MTCATLDGESVPIPTKPGVERCAYFDLRGAIERAVAAFGEREARRVVEYLFACVAAGRKPG